MKSGWQKSERSSLRGFVKRTLPPEALQEVNARLEQAHKAFQRRYPGPSAERQPVHVVYGGAHLFRCGDRQALWRTRAEIPRRICTEFCGLCQGSIGCRMRPACRIRRRRLRRSRNPSRRSRKRRGAKTVRRGSQHTIYRRVREKLKREPVEDFRIDFEDGYGNRPDEEEDGHAAAAAEEVARGMNAGELPPFLGIRIKPLTEELRARSIRTLDIFLTQLASKSRGEVAEATSASRCRRWRCPMKWRRLRIFARAWNRCLIWTPGVLRIELMIETPQSIFNERGEANLLPLVRRRARPLHRRSFRHRTITLRRCNIAATYQPLTHFASGFARESDAGGAGGNRHSAFRRPDEYHAVPPHRAAKEGSTLTAAQTEENRAAVHRGWKLHFENIRHSLAKRLLPGMGLPSGATSRPLCGRIFIFP